MESEQQALTEFEEVWTAITFSKTNGNRLGRSVIGQSS
jgi:hypothetical protein